MNHDPFSGLLSGLAQSNVIFSTIRANEQLSRGYINLTVPVNLGKSPETLVRSTQI